MADLEKIRKLGIKRQKEVEQSSKQLNEFLDDKKRRNKKTLSFLMAIFVLLFLVGAGFAYSYLFFPGPYDDFAKCLTEKGMVIYGADGCQYTQEQRAMFGKSFKFVNYKDFSKGPDIKVTPTWVLNGEKYEKTQSFERLSEITGCPL